MSLDPATEQRLWGSPGRESASYSSIDLVLQEKEDLIQLLLELPPSEKSEREIEK
jgi:hypothetical protein